MKYVLYCRKSTDDEGKQVLSLDSQEQEMLTFAKECGLEVVQVLRESQSAKAEGRPVFASLLASIQSGEVDAILCWKLDRLARNMADAGRVIDLLQRGVIKQIRTHDAVHLPTDNVLMLAVQLGMANQYIRDLSENVKRGNRTKLEQGGWPNRAPFGYKNDLATKEIVIDPQRGSLVARAFQLYAVSEMSYRDVANIMRTEGFTTESGGYIGTSLIERIIKNPFYMGIMYSNGKYYNGNHEPIISKALFEQAQLVQKVRSKPKEKKLMFPLRGLLTCASCGCMYTATIKKGHQYYYCTNGKGACTAHSKYLRSEPATELVAKALEALRFDIDLIGIMYDAARERDQGRTSYVEAIEKRLQGQLRSLEHQESMAFDYVSQGLMRPELYEEKIKVIKNSRMLIEKDLTDLKKQDLKSTLEPIKDAFIQANTALERFLAAEPEQQKAIAAEVLWNLTVQDGETQEVRYRSYYEVLAKAPKSANLETLLAE